MRDEASTAYGALPERLYILLDRKIVYQGDDVFRYTVDYNDNNICREVSVLTITIRRKSIRGWKNIFRNSVDNIIYSTWFVVDDDVLNKALSKHLMIKQNARDIIKISRILESRINISTFPLLYSVNNVRGDTSIFSWQGTLTTEWQSQSFNFDCIVVLCYGVITTI